MTHDQFKAYVTSRAATGLTRNQIAAEIATGRSQFFDYLNGKAKVSRRVELLCMAVLRKPVEAGLVPVKDDQTEEKE